jgi:DNA repair photolyase
LEPNAPPPSARLEMLTQAAQLGIPVYVAIAPFMPFDSLDVLDEVVRRVRPLSPTEIFCEVLNPKGKCVEMIAGALKAGHPEQSRIVAGYEEAAWSRWTHQVLRHGAGAHAGLGFTPWPDTSRVWARHLPATQVEFLEQFLPPAGG